MINSACKKLIFFDFLKFDFDRWIILKSKNQILQTSRQPPFHMAWNYNYSKRNIHTGWCILSRTTGIPHMVRQGDAPGYYPSVILLIWNILTRTTEVMCVNKLGRMCDVMWMMSRIVRKQSFCRLSVFMKNSRKCIKTILKVSLINIFN